MESGVKRAMIVPYNSPLLGIADESVAQRLADEVERSANAGRVATASSLPAIARARQPRFSASDSLRLRSAAGRAAR